MQSIISYSDVYRVEQKKWRQVERKFQPGCSQPQPAMPGSCLAKQSLFSAQLCITWTKFPILDICRCYCRHVLDWLSDLKIDGNPIWQQRHEFKSRIEIEGGNWSFDEFLRLNAIFGYRADYGATYIEMGKKLFPRLREGALSARGGITQPRTHLFGHREGYSDRHAKE